MLRSLEDSCELKASEIRVLNLSEKAVSILSDTYPLSTEDCNILSKPVLKHARRNAFYIIQLMQALEEIGVARNSTDGVSVSLEGKTRVA